MSTTSATMHAGSTSSAAVGGTTITRATMGGPTSVAVNGSTSGVRSARAAEKDSTTDGSEAHIGSAKAGKPRGRQPKQLGGVILFYHVAKTGGTSVRRIFGQNQGMKRLVTYHRYKFDVPRGVNASAEVQAEGTDPCVPQPQGRQRRVLSRTDQLIKDHIRQPDANEQRILFVEIHGGSPGLEGLVPYIQAWRRLGQNHNKTFFAFTLVREPLAFALSYFKFFHAECSLRRCEHVQYKEYSPTNLLLSARAHANQQCFLLKHFH